MTLSNYGRTVTRRAKRPTPQEREWLDRIACEMARETPDNAASSSYASAWATMLVYADWQEEHNNAEAPGWRWLATHCKAPRFDLRYWCWDRASEGKPEFSASLPTDAFCTLPRPLRFDHRHEAYYASRYFVSRQTALRYGARAVARMMQQKEWTARLNQLAEAEHARR